MHIVYGGAFNPPTVAHLETYRFMMERIKVDSFIFLPVSSAYTKSDLASNHHRLNMLKLLIKDLPQATVSEIEIQDTDFMGTYHSLNRLSESLSGDVAFLIGADNLAELHTWKMAESLLSEYVFIVLNRQDDSVEDLIEGDPFLRRHRHHLLVFQDFDVAVSSTVFRDTMNPDMVPKAIWDYIKEHQLYRR